MNDGHTCANMTVFTDMLIDLNGALRLSSGRLLVFLS